jgi:hypothetical protein
VLASNVGEAVRVLDSEMLVQYEGVKDAGYPQRLRERILAILDHPELLDRSKANTRLAKEHFDYVILAERMKRVIEISLKATKVSQQQIVAEHVPSRTARNS